MLSSLEKSPYYDVQRSLGGLAIELLASQVGLRKLIEFYTERTDGGTWQETFERVFNISVPDFYELFDEHRRNGFPLRELPIVGDTNWPERIKAFRQARVVALLLLGLALAAVQLGCKGDLLVEDVDAGTPLGDVHYPTAPLQTDSYVKAGEPVRLERTWDSEWDPAWSPDGTRIAFVCEDYRAYTRRGEALNVPISPVIVIHGNICVMNADGSGSVQLTENNSEDYAPAWSPDGSRIAFTSYRSPQGVIYMINGDGSGLWRITLDEYSNVQPAWSPEGRLIAFSSRRDGDFDIYVVNTDRSGLTQVTDTPHRDETEPAWSPDGQQVAFACDSEEGSGIFLVNLDGSGERLVHASAGNPRSPAWSPDGRRIAFVSDVGVDGVENLEIFVVNIDGTGLTRLTNRPKWDSDPAWSPDGRRIVFTSNNGWNSEIYVMEVEP